MFFHTEGGFPRHLENLPVIWHSFPVILLQSVTALGKKFLNHHYMLSTQKYIIAVANVNKLIQSNNSKS